MESLKVIAFYFLLEFLVGSIMFSYIIGIILGRDIRQYGDGNPGGYNLYHATNKVAGIIGSLLDYSKGFIPLYFILKSHNFPILAQSLISIAPLLGHIFSPLLKGRGGKGVATTFGIWSALTTFEFPIVFAFFLIIYPFFVKSGGAETPEFNALRVNISFLLSGIFIYFTRKELLLVFLLNAILLIYSHRKDLSNIPARLKERFL